MASGFKTDIKFRPFRNAKDEIISGAYDREICRAVPKLGKWSCVMTESGMEVFETVIGQQGLAAKAKTDWLVQERCDGRTAAEALESWNMTHAFR